MPSLIQGYEYDIFISYRQKDNKHDGWVTEFVKNLKGELESTFKEEISVYFDINPLDGLLETHDVDASLKEKLKCLVFIPIISRTYCDPKSFAWEHEFKAFIEQASKDQIGLKVKLPNGNIANRVLPVRIYDLDSTDIKLCESILGGVLRGVEFIYKSSGVNRPLLSKEVNPQENLNHTNYRDQVNKIANAIKDIVYTIKQREQKPEKVSEEVYTQIPGTRKSSKTKIIAGSIIVLVMIIFGCFLIPKLSLTGREYEKSIAVLPFFNDSPDEANAHLLNGITDEILNNLQVIKDLRVISRSSVEQYRGTNRPTSPKIAKELDVNYLVEGSGQKYGNVLRLRVQLIEAVTDKHLWANMYEQEINEARDIFHLQSQIAEAIAAELKAIITPDEKELIGKIPTADITAYELYLKANDFSKEYGKTRNLSDYQTAVNLYKTAIEIDSAFARAYTGLAGIYGLRYYYEAYFKKNFLDSTLILADIALSFDDQLDEAYYIKAQYYRSSGLIEKSLENLDQALKFNPNYYQVYSAKGALLAWVYKDFVKGIDNYQRALNLIGGKDRILLLRNLGRAYLDIGFIEKSKYYYNEALRLDNDSANYFGALAWIEFSRENFEGALELAKRANRIDTTKFISIEYYTCLPSNYREESFLNAVKRMERSKKSGILDLQLSHRIGYAYWQMGRFKEAEDFFKRQIKYGVESIKLGREISQNKAAQYDLAATYAFSGKKEIAYQYLDEFSKMNTYPLWWISLAKHDPLFDSIRNEERFQKMVQNMEAKHLAEHERVRKWMEEKKAP
jgi:TolB-like protein